MVTQLALREAALTFADVELASMAEKVEMRAWQDIVNAAPLWLRVSMEMVAEEGDGVLLLASRGIPSLLFNRVIGLGKQEPATDRRIGDVMDRYWTMGIANYWVHAGPYAQPVRMGRRLQNHGLTLYRRSWVKMMREARLMPSVNASMNVRLARADDAHHVASIVGPAFDLRQRGAELFANLVERRRWTVLVAELESQVIATAGLFIDDDIAYLAFAATRPEFQCRGAQRALVQARVNLATNAGCRWIATETGFPLAADEPNPSYHNMLRAGFRPVEIRDNYAPPGTRWQGEELQSVECEA
jgi:GNAT superfamily N-acetyltransferase